MWFFVIIASAETLVIFNTTADYNCNKANLIVLALSQSFYGATSIKRPFHRVYGAISIKRDSEKTSYHSSFGKIFSGK